MKQIAFILIFLVVGGSAHSNPSDCLKYEKGKVTSCDPKATVYHEKKPNGVEIFASGSAGKTLAERRFAYRENSILEVIDEFKNLVFPITEKNGKIVGTAFRYNGLSLTALHVVHTASAERPLYVYSAKHHKSILIRGYATLKRELDVVNSIDYYDDFCILDIPELDNTTSFAASPLPILTRFEYLEMSYPKGNNSPLEPSASSSHVSLPQTSRDRLVTLNRNGQDFNSSGGPVIDVATRQVRAMNICLEVPSNTVKALDLYYLNPRIEKALSSGYVPWLSNYAYHFPHYTANERPPIGGRGGGP
ncbi:MAG: hypothetical protein A4S09_17590 [Proteobacteria bacterium SG_bin7]|nr:MAG: hypothetical protein A4S09_17590 [Proteobacteria bacterium SG_bin7]